MMGSDLNEDVQQSAVPKQRVQLTYEVELYGTVKTVAFPFVVAVVADLHGDSTAEQWNSPVADRKFLDFDLDNLDHRINSMRPALQVTGLDGVLDTLTFTSLDDFSPLEIARRHIATRELLERRTMLAELQGRLLAHRELLDMLRALLSRGPRDLKDAPPWFAGGDEDPERTNASFALLLDELDGGLLAKDSDPMTAVSDRVHALDYELGKHVTHVLRDPVFLRLEGAWRGLGHLLGQQGAYDLSRVRVMSLRRQELARALDDGGAALQKKLVDESFGQFDGEPIGIWVLADEFSHFAEDVALLRTAAGIAARADAIVVAGAAPSILDADAFATVIPARGARLQRLSEYESWRDLRRDPAALRVSLVVPRVVGRDPHAVAGLGYGEFRYLEPPGPADTAPWMNGAFALAAGMLRAQVRDGWPAALDTSMAQVALPSGAAWTGVDASGVLQVRAPLDATFSMADAAQLAGFGLAVLGRMPNTSTALLLAAPSLYVRPQAIEGSHPDWGELAIGMALNQIVRWVRCWARDRIGVWSEVSAFLDDLERLLWSRTVGGETADLRADDGAARTPALLQAADVVGFQASVPDAAKPQAVLLTVRLSLQLSWGFVRTLPAVPVTVTVPLRIG